MMKVFDWRVRQNGNFAVIDLTGDFSSGAEESLRLAFDEALHSGKEGIFLNFTYIGTFNSYGIAMLIRLLIRAKTLPQRFAAYGLSNHYHNLFRITRLTDFIPIYADEKQAAAEFMKPS